MESEKNMTNEKENTEEIVTLGDLLETAKEEVVEHIKGIGNLKLKPLTLEMSSVMRKRAS